MIKCKYHINTTNSTTELPTHSPYSVMDNWSYFVRHTASVAELHVVKI